MVELNKDNKGVDVNKLIKIDELELLLKKDIKISGNEQENLLGVIHQPTIQDIINCGGEKFFATYLSIFCLTKEILLKELWNEEDATSNIDVNKVKLLDLFFLTLSNKQDNVDIVRQYNQLLLTGLTIFYKTTNIKYLKEDIGFIIDDKYIINRDNFDTLCAYIRLITCQEVAKIKEKPKNMSARRKDVYEKLMKGRQRKEQQNYIGIIDMINTLIVDKRLINYDEYLNLTYYQLIHTYKVICFKSINNTQQIYCTVDVDPKSMKNSIWISNIKELNKKQI